MDVNTVWLKEDCGPNAFFPGPDNSDFQFTADVGESITSFIVKGISSEYHGPSTSSHVVTSNPAAPAHKSLFSPKKVPSANVKVVQANFYRSSNGKPEFDKSGQTFVDVSDATANVFYINGVIQSKWGKEYVVVTGDGLKIEDSSGTQGMCFANNYKFQVSTFSSVHAGLKFWKVGSRRVFAVPEYQIKGKGKGKGKGKKRRDDTSDSDDESRPPPKKTHITQTRELLNEVKLVKSGLDAIMSVTKGMKLPPGLYKQLADTFKCHICHITPMRIPIIFTRCCKSILGCEECVDKWYASGQNSNTCPLCRAERAYSETCRVNGFDGFLSIIRPLMSDEPAVLTDDDDFVM